MPALPTSIHERHETEGLAIGVPRPDGSVVVECDASVHGHRSAVLRDRREGGHAAESVVAIGPHRACLEPELSEDALRHWIGGLCDRCGVAAVGPVGQAHRDELLADPATCEPLGDTQQKQVQELAWFDAPIGPVLSIDLTKKIEDRIELLGDGAQALRRWRCRVLGQ